MLTALIVLTRILVNPLSNVFQKHLSRKSAHPTVILATTHLLLVLPVLPLLLGPVQLDASIPFWTNLTLCSLLAVVSNLLLIRALQTSDLSVLGPLNAYKSVISLLLGIFLVSEIPNLPGVAGILLIVAGSVCLINRAPGQPRRHALIQFVQDPGIRLRFLALALSATEAIFLKRTLHLAPALSVFTGWCLLCCPLAALALAFEFRGRLPAAWRNQRPQLPAFAALAISTGIMQVMSLLTFERMSVGYSLALFQLSALVSVLFGHHFFREGHLQRRLFGASVMILGATLIVAFGHR
jgi:drug/metabolite transporter (DMT)-like permease